ncbi:MAG: hypothetical protein WC809_17770 [Sinimarinibacterium sp.]|jgi:hypothetical protein
MDRPVAAFVLMLALLLQGLASAWAAPMALTRMTAPTPAESAMPCHEMAAGAEHRTGSGMACCDDGIDCTHCDAVCGSNPPPPADAALLDDYLDAHYALMRRTDTVLLAHPLDLLRPPITLLR